MSGENLKCALVSVSADETFSAALDMGQVCNSFTMQINPSAGTNAGVVELQGSLDGVNFTTTALTTITLTNTDIVQAYAVDKPNRYVRVRISTVIGVGTITVFVAGSNVTR